MEIPIGLCQCGCGEKTNIAKRNYNTQRIKVVKGEPYHFLKGHCNLVRHETRPEYVTDKNGCWIWQRCKGKGGYGKVQRKESASGEAHRYYYEKFKGAIPEGLQLDHLCRNPLCVNPDHLEPVTLTENVRRGDCTKLRLDEIARIRNLKNSGQSQREVAEDFGVTQSHVSRLMRGLHWN